MDLKNNQITIRELMAHPQARAVLAKHFPQVIHLPIVTKSAGMTLERAMATRTLLGFIFKSSAISS